MSRRVLVTGGASGLGAALVDAFVARGDQVLVTDLASGLDKLDQRNGLDKLDRRDGLDKLDRRDGLDKLDRRDGLDKLDRRSYLALDVTSDDDWATARAWVDEHWGGLDVLVNNAGIATGGRIDVVTLDEWRHVIDLNLLGVVRGCRTFVPLFKAQGSGHIVNTASLAGLVHPPAMGSYTAVKAGVVALSETLSYELDPFGVTTTAVCPSFFRTNLASSLAGTDTAVDAVAARLIERSTITADQIAAEVMKGIDRKQAVVVPDAPARKAVWTKRFARPLYDREQRRFAARIHALTTGLDTGAERPARPPKGQA